MADGVFMVENTWGCNVYVICGSKTVMVDAGFPVDQRRIRKQIEENRAVADGVDLVVATHYHLDHVGAIAGLKDAFEMEVAAHEEDAKVIEGERPYQRFKVDRLRTIYYKALSPLYRYEHATVEFKLKDGDTLGVVEPLSLIHLPGHTDGSVAVFCEERGILFTGDSIRNEKGVLEGPPPLFTPDMEKTFWGIKERIMGLHFETLLPGHGEPVRRGARARLEKMLVEQGRMGLWR